MEFAERMKDVANLAYVIQNLVACSRVVFHSIIDKLPTGWVKWYSDPVVGGGVYLSFSTELFFKKHK